MYGTTYTQYTDTIIGQVPTLTPGYGGAFIPLPPPPPPVFQPIDNGGIEPPPYSPAPPPGPVYYPPPLPSSPAPLPRDNGNGNGNGNGTVAGLWQLAKDNPLIALAIAYFGARALNIIK